MAKGISIPLTIKGLRDAKNDFAELKKQVKETSDVKLSQKLTKQINILGKEIDDTTASMLDMNAAGKLMGTRFDDLQEVLFDVNEEVLPLTSQIGEMEDRMYQLATAGDTTSVEFVTLQKETARLRRVIIETDKSVDLLAENSGLGVFAEGWMGIGGSIARLDFKGAEQGAMRLEGAMGSMTTIAKGGMKSLGKTVKILGKSFIKFGITILTNPLFLLVAVIGGLITGMVLLKDKVAFIGTIFEAIMVPINAIIQAFKNLLDWIGLTSFAEDELAEAQVKRSEARLKQLKKENEAIEATNVIENRRTANVLKGIDIDKRKAKLNGASAKELAALDEKALNATIKQLKTDKEAFKKKQINNAKGFKEFGDLQKAKALLEKNGSVAQKKLLSSASYNYKQHTKELVKIKKGNALKLSEIDKQIAEAEIASQEQTESDAKDRRDKYKSYAENRLAAARSIQDLELDLMADGIEKEVSILNTKFDRQIEDTLSSETLKQEEKEKIVKYYESLRAAEEGELRLKKIEEEAKLQQKLIDDAAKFQEASDNSALAKIEGFQEAAYQMSLTDEKREREALEYKYVNQLALAEQYGQDTTAIKEAQLQEEAKLEKKYSDKAKELKRKEIEGNAQLAIGGLQLVAGIADLFANKSEKAAKIAFNVQKAASIAQAAMDGYKAVLSTYAGTPGGPVIKGIAAGIAGGFSAVQIANIAKTKFDGGGGASPSAGIPSGDISGGGTSVAPSTPSFELFGQPNDFNNVEGGASAEQSITVNAIVSETEITNSQNTISNIQQSAEL